MTDEDTLTLEVRRVIAASPDRLFSAWTEPAQLRAWWGPRGVRCSHAEVDLRVGGRYRIDNTLPDGNVVVIQGEFLRIERPETLAYTWTVSPGGGNSERVTVRFTALGSQTEVLVVHERIPSAPIRDGHAGGWEGCLDGLSSFLARASPTA